MPAPFAWIEIPAVGVTLRHINKSGDYENPRLVELPTYCIAKYPVTNAQFALFVQAGGYRERKWWTEEGWRLLERWGWPEPRDWEMPHFNGPEQPVTSISWYEAIAFCLWLSDATGEKILLPTDDQWQYAAQSDDGREYPWGNGWDSSRCTSWKASLPGEETDPSPVQQYDGKGDSPFGVVDMAGNVYEWCLTECDGWTNDIFCVAERRVLRGGAWYHSHPIHFRCDFPFRGVARARISSWGFRISRAP